MSLGTSEVAVRLAGSGAKQPAILIYAILWERKKTADKARLTNMLRSDKELKVFAVKNSDLQLFCQEAKRYDVLHYVLKDRDAMDRLADIMARAEDAGKINRIIEWSDLTAVDMIQIRQGIEQSRAERRADAPETPAAESTVGVDTPQRPMTEREIGGFLDATLTPALEDGVATPKRTQLGRDVDEFLKAARGASSGRKEDRTENLIVGQIKKSRPSALTLRPKGADNPGIPDSLGCPRPSARQALKEIWAEQRQRAGEKIRENAGRQKPIQYRVPSEKKVRKQEER